MTLLTNKRATSATPQIVTVIVDDSNSMRDLVDGEKSKARIATESVMDLVVTTQACNQGSAGFRYLLNIAKCGYQVTPIAEAAAPEDIDIETLEFHGDSGRTNVAQALEWGAVSLKQAMAKCRALPAYDERKAPSPLVVFLSDGENTAPEMEEAAARLRAMPFDGGKVNVIVCGIAMKPEQFAVMQRLASSEECAVNIKPSELWTFLASIGATPDVPAIAQASPQIDHMQAMNRHVSKSLDEKAQEVARSHDPINE